VNVVPSAANLEPLESVDPGLILRRRDVMPRAQLVDVLGEILDELRHVIEQQWLLELPGSPHLADLRFPGARICSRFSRRKSASRRGSSLASRSAMPRS